MTREKLEKTLNNGQGRDHGIGSNDEMAMARHV